MDDTSSYNKITKVVLISITIYFIIALAEIITGIFTNSLSVLADGFDSIGNGLVSLIVLIGLMLSKKAPNETFNFGYYRVEVLAGLLASIAAIILAIYIVYAAFLNMFNSHTVSNTSLALTITTIALISALIFSMIKYYYSKKLNLISVKTDSANSFKDSLSSTAAIVGVILSDFGFYFFDLIAALIIATFIISVCLVIIKESSLILVDACNNPEIKNKIKEITKEIPHIIKVLDIRLRRLGSKIAAEIEIEMDAEITVKKMHEIIKLYEKKIKETLIGISHIGIIVRA